MISTTNLILAAMLLPAPGRAAPRPAAHVAGVSARAYESGPSATSSARDAGRDRHRRRRFHVTPKDRAATEALLRAQYAYARAVVAHLPASLAAVRALGAKLDEECPGVLHGAPRPEAPPFLEEPSGPALTAKQQGEAARAERQRGVLEAELTSVLAAAVFAPDRAAARALQSTVEQLRWSSRRITTLIHQADGASEALSAGPAPAVCADMRAWAASGFKALSPQSKAFMATQEARERQAIRTLSRESGADPETLLHASTSRRARVIERRLDALGRRVVRGLEAITRVTRHVRAALGAGEPSAPPSHPRGSRLLAHGRTASRARYEVWLAPPPSPGQHARCKLDLVVEQSEVIRRGRSLTVVFNSTREVCLSRTRPIPPQVACEGGHFEIEGQALAGAARVRLTLADRRTVTSRVAIVPPARGGPVGFYLQAVPGNGPSPVSLTELGRRGQVMRVVHLHSPHQCVVRPARPPVVLPGARTLARGRLPHGPSFVIRGEQVRFMGRTRFRLEAQVPPGSPPGLGVGFSGPAPDTPLSPFGGHSSPFAREAERGCRPHEYALLYGILAKPRDTVLARTVHGLEQLRRVPIPRELHVHGVLAYIALEALPDAIVVRGPGGNTVATEDLSGPARELREICAGEAEP